MSAGNNSSSVKPLLIGAIVGLIIGLGVGLAWAWLVQPAFYAGGAYPNELTEADQITYVRSVSEAYLTTRDIVAAANRLGKFTAEQKVTLLATVAKDFSGKGQNTEANLVSDLAATLMKQENWSVEDVSAGLSAATATEEFSAKLGLVPQAGAAAESPVEPAAPETEAAAPDAAPAGSGLSLGRIAAVLAIVLLAIGLVLFLLTRVNRPRRTTALSQKLPQEMVTEAGTTLQPLRQWNGVFTLGQDTYDESFTIETGAGDFLGECGMGILDGFAAGSDTPKKVLALDVWLFDKTDIRTISMPVMSKYAFEDEALRSKLPPAATPVLAAEGNTFDIETTALIVKARIDEVTYMDGPPDMAVFTSLRVTLSAYLKPDVDISGSMPIPEGYA